MIRAVWPSRQGAHVIPAVSHFPGIVGYCAGISASHNNKQPGRVLTRTSHNTPLLPDRSLLCWPAGNTPPATVNLVSGQAGRPDPCPGAGSHGGLDWAEDVYLPIIVGYLRLMCSHTGRHPGPTLLLQWGPAAGVTTRS